MQSYGSMAWKNQTVLVTGAGGFIGSHLVERLMALGARTRGLVQYNSAGNWEWLDDSLIKDDVEVFLGDIRDPSSLRQAFRGVDVVFHLAALIAIPYSFQSPVSYVRTNVEGTLNVLQAALDFDASLVVHTSTSEVFGTARYVPMDETHPLQGQSPYAASKIGADKIAEAFHLSYGLPITTIRPFNTYGPRQSARAVIPTIISQALAESVISLGSLLPIRDFNYVSDTVEGFVQIAECPKAIGEVINIGSGREIAIGKLVETILRLMGKDIPIVSSGERIRPQASEVDRLCADNRKASELVGWRPQYSLENGLIETIRWVQSHSETYRTGVYAV